MPDDDVSSLLQRFADCGCNASFAALVARYRHLVHGAALQRLNGNAAMADDVVQRVFIQLAAHAHSLDASQGLGGWLYHCAIHTAADLQRSESRRRSRELIAAAAPTTAPSATPWSITSPTPPSAKPSPATSSSNRPTVLTSQTQSSPSSPRNNSS